MAKVNFKGVKLAKGKTAYWDPKTRTHLTISRNKRLFSKKERGNLNFKNIESALSSGALVSIPLKEEDSKASKKEKVEENNQEDISTEESTEEKLEKVTSERKPRCQEIKSDGSQCTYDAKYPEDNPKYCGIHKKSLEE